MPLYLSRFSYTPETWARLIGNPEDRRKAAQDYIESVGGTLGFWYAFGTHDGYNPDNIVILQSGAGFSLYRDRGNVSMDVQNTEVLHVNTFTGNDTVATTGLVGTTQYLQTIQDGLPDTLTFDAAGLCPLTAPGGIEAPGRGPVQHTNFANVSVINDTCVPDTCMGMEATSGCTVNGVPNQRCIGTAGNDVIKGTAGADVITGGAGNDRIYTGAGSPITLASRRDAVLSRAKLESGGRIS